MCSIVAVSSPAQYEEYSLIGDADGIRVGRWNEETHSGGGQGATGRVFNVPFGSVVPQQRVALSSLNLTLCVCVCSRNTNQMSLIGVLVCFAKFIRD